MKIKQNSLMLILAVLAGFVGGTISNQIPMIQTAFAEKKSKPEKVIEANEFRLIDKYGNQIASLKGKDFPHNRVLTPEEFEAMPGSRERLKDIKIQIPVLEMRTKFFKLPITSELTASSLIFKEGGMVTNLNFGGLSVMSGDTYSRISDDSIRVFHRDTSLVALGLSNPPKNLPSLTITDAEGNQAVLGHVSLRSKKTGTSIERSAASLVLFDKKGNVIWSTPE